MAPKASSGKSKAPVIEETESLQAILFADSFDKRFEPLSITTPRCLLPVCNAILLEWTLECLAASGVDKVFVVCRSHRDQIDAAVQNSVWSKEGSGIEIVIVNLPRETISFGDAMRDLCNRKLVTSDFLLVHGDLVCNIRVDEAVRLHRARFKANKDCIMTILVKESGLEHRTRPRGESSIFVVQPETSECVYFQALPGLPVTTHANMPRELLKAHPELEIRNDLIDCGIDVCAFEVMSLFEDNFDWQELRRDFVHGVLSSEILMKSIHYYVVQDGYAARVRDTKSYDAVSKDILSRWTFPLVPDDNMPGSSGGYSLQRGNTYLSLSPAPLLARTAEVGPVALLGPNTSVGSDACVQRSVLGARCSIGPGAIVRDSYLWDGVVVEAGALIEHSILGKDVRVKAGSTIARGCLVGDGVIIGPDARLANFSRVSRKGLRGERSEDDDDEEDEEDEISFEAMEAAQTEEMRRQLGTDSNGIIWPDHLGHDEDDEDSHFSIANARLGRIGDPGSDLELTDEGTDTEEDDSDDSDASSNVPRRKRNRGASVSSMSSATSASLAGGKPLSAAEREFRSEAHATLIRAFAEGHRVDDCVTELKTLRLASNASWISMHEVVVRTVVDEVKVSASVDAGQSKEVARVIERWGQLISKVAGSEPVATLRILQEHCARSSKVGIFGPLLASFYQNDIVEDDDISVWHKLPSSNPEPSNDIAQNMRKCWVVGGKLLEHLNDETDSEDEDESEDEDGEEDGDEEGSSEEDSE